MCFAVYDMDGSRDGLGKTIGFARVISDGEELVVNTFPIPLF